MWNRTTLTNPYGGVFVHTYDGANRLTNVRTGANRSTYSYNGDGLRRTRQEQGGALGTMIWDGDDYLMEKTP